MDLIELEIKVTTQIIFSRVVLTFFRVCPFKGPPEVKRKYDDVQESGSSTEQ